MGCDDDDFVFQEPNDLLMQPAACPSEIKINNYYCDVMLNEFWSPIKGKITKHRITF